VIDQAETRRGKVSANYVWGNAASVLVGDFLYSKSFKLMADEDNLAIIKLMSATPMSCRKARSFNWSSAVISTSRRGVPDHHREEDLHSHGGSLRIRSHPGKRSTRAD